MTSTRMFGPFVHHLNKGGLAEIRTTSKLRGSTASNYMANDSIAVRAHVGSYEYQKQNKNWHGRTSTFIEFTTAISPRSGLPPGYAEWTSSELIDGSLPITITRVLNGEGEPV